MKALTQQEMAGIEGGFIPIGAALIWLTGVCVGVGIGNIAENWPDFKKGMMEGYSGSSVSN